MRIQRPAPDLGRAATDFGQIHFIRPTRAHLLGDLRQLFANAAFLGHGFGNIRNHITQSGPKGRFRLRRRNGHRCQAAQQPIHNAGWQCRLCQLDLGQGRIQRSAAP